MIEHQIYTIHDGKEMELTCSITLPAVPRVGDYIDAPKTHGDFDALFVVRKVNFRPDSKIVDLWINLQIFSGEDTIGEMLEKLHFIE